MKIDITSTYTATDLLPMEIIRMHVRALDDSEDTLLAYYLDTAIDYLAQQTNRVLGTSVATVVLDRSEVSEVVRLHGLNDAQSLSVEYLTTSGAYSALDLAEYSARLDYPLTLDLTEALPSDMSESDEDLFRVSIVCGANLSTLNKQYTQAALLLVGHYYNQRETEVIGQITSELKEGVRRLIMSARQF